MYTWITLNSAADLAELKAKLTPEYDPERVADKLSNGISDAVKGLLIEHNYVDKDYRSTYYNFYSKKGLHYRTDCVRLHFFDSTVKFNDKGLKLIWNDERIDDHYFGFMVLRPTGISTIGRSVLSADVRSGATGEIITSNHKVHLLGYKLGVRGFPSMDQHNDISVCAHAACWSILRHYSDRYSTYREYLTHDITLMTQEFNPGGLVPSRGLQVSHAERVFLEAGTFPVHVARATPNDPSFYRQLTAYVDSGFPLFAAMQRKGHAIAVIGLEWGSPAATPGFLYAWDIVKSLVVVDDNHLPYLPVSRQGGTPYSVTDIDAFIVALPEKVFYPADAVDRLAPTLLKFGAVVGLPQQNDTVIRYFITTCSALRQFMRNRETEFDPKLLEAVMKLPLAQFIWVVEFSTKTQWDAGQIETRAVLDATASLRESMPFWLIHNRKQALFFGRRTAGLDLNISGLTLTGMEHMSLTKMDQNLRPIQTK